MIDDSLPARLPEDDEPWQALRTRDTATRFASLARQSRSDPDRPPADTGQAAPVFHSIHDYPPGPYSLLSPLDLLRDIPPSDRIRRIIDVIAERTPAAEDQQHTYLAALADLRHYLRPTVIRLEDDLAKAAVRAGAGMAELAAAIGVTPQGATDRWGHLQGEHVVVVISRRDRSRTATSGDPRTIIGEVGGPDQYDSDRMYWRIGAEVRAHARHAVIAVDGTVRRVYEIDPEGWYQNPTDPAKWGFHAIGGVPLGAAVVGELHAAEQLPYAIGSECPTRVGGAYRPERF